MNLNDKKVSIIAGFERACFDQFSWWHQDGDQLSFPRSGVLSCCFLDDFDNFWQLWQLLALLTSFGNFEKFWQKNAIAIFNLSAFRNFPALFLSGVGTAILHTSSGSAWLWQGHPARRLSQIFSRQPLPRWSQWAYHTINQSFPNQVFSRVGSMNVSIADAHRHITKLPSFPFHQVFSFHHSNNHHFAKLYSIMLNL